ncbi:MAG: efflux RND transporter periplasmic adaptor subunit [Marmoricola sp.]
MAKREKWWGGLAVLVLVLAGGGVWLTTAGGASSTGTQRITSTVAKGTYKTTVSATGTITPKHDEDLTFSSSGTVTAVEVVVGDKVLEGDVLAKIDDTALVAQREAAASQVTAAESQLSEDAGGTSTQIASDEAALSSARAQLTQAQDAVANATLRAPFSGTVSAVGYAVGDTVGGTGSQGGGTSTPAITVISAKKLLVDANVSASDVSELKKGMQATITPTGGSQTVYGVVTQVGVIASASDSGAAQFPVTIEVTGAPRGMYPGASATVEITVKQATDILAVPTAAVHTASDGTSYVNVVKNGKATRTDVKLGEVYGAQTQVLSGVEVGDVIEIISITGRRGTGTNSNGNRGNFSFPGGGEIPGGATFSGGGKAPSFVGNGG